MNLIVQAFLFVEINCPPCEAVYLGEDEGVVEVVGGARVAQDGHDLLLHLPLVLR